MSLPTGSPTSPTAESKQVKSSLPSLPTAKPVSAIWNGRSTCYCAKPTNFTLRCIGGVSIAVIIIGLGLLRQHRIIGTAATLLGAFGAYTAFKTFKGPNDLENALRFLVSNNDATQSLETLLQIRIPPSTLPIKPEDMLEPIMSVTLDNGKSTKIVGVAFKFLWNEPRGPNGLRPRSSVECVEVYDFARALEGGITVSHSMSELDYDYLKSKFPPRVPPIMPLVPLTPPKEAGEATPVSVPGSETPASSPVTTV